MTSLAAANPDVRTFSATVETVDGRTVVLDESYFYPEGGGQPADRGTLDGVDVTDVQYGSTGVVHELAAEPSFEPGDTIEGVVDDAFRTYCMRAHTASHILYGAGRRLFDGLGYGGFDISASRVAGNEARIEGKIRVDFATTTDVDDETLVELERLTNEAVCESRDVTWEEVPRETALDRDDVAFNTKTEEGLGEETVRIVTIEDWDVAACGGTHVRNSLQVGPVTVLDRSNPGEGLTRVEFTVGPSAIDARAMQYDRALDAAGRLDTTVSDLPDAVARLQDEVESLTAERDAFRAALVDARISELREDVVERDGVRWLIGTLPELDANGLSDRTQAVAGEDADVVAFVDEDGTYLAVASTGAVDAGDVVSDVTDEFGGGGGGSPTVAQGGGLDADAAAIVSYLREKR